MGRADRAFLGLALAAAATIAVLALALALTLFPAAFQRAIHGYEAVAQFCAAALYRVGEALPPLGALVLSLAATTVFAGAFQAMTIVRRTGRALAFRRPVRLPRRLARAAERAGIGGRVACFADRCPAAHCSGLLRPRVWVSTAAVHRLRRTELDAVLSHEAYHLRRRDPLRILIARSLSAALFPVPLMRALHERFEVAKELDADVSALRTVGSRAALAGALYKLARGDRGLEPRQLAIGAWSLSRARVDQVCGTDPAELLPPVGRRAALLTAGMLALLLVLAAGQAARANLVPASVLEGLGLGALPTEIHECPIPKGGILL